MARQHFQHRDGKVLLVEQQEGGEFKWSVWGASPDGKAITGIRGTLEHAKAEAEEVAGLRPPAPPAWMVEVAREANAVGYDAANMDGAAADVRAGNRDTDSETATAVRALRLAIERGHVVEPDPDRPKGRVTNCYVSSRGETVFTGLADGTIVATLDGYSILPVEKLSHEDANSLANGSALVVRRRAWTDDDLLKAAREDAAQVLRASGYAQPLIDRVLHGGSDGDIWVTAALQARRNLLREMGAVDPDFREVYEPGVMPGSRSFWRMMQGGMDTAKPGSDRTAAMVRLPYGGAFDLEAALKRAWDAGWDTAEDALTALAKRGSMGLPQFKDKERSNDVSAILSTLPAKE